MRFPALVVLVAAALTLGCNEYRLSGSEYYETFQQTPSVAVDILFVVDNSPSMVQEHAAVIQGFGAFIGEVMESESDFHIGVITTDMETHEGGILLGDPPWIATTDPDYGLAFMDKIEVVGIGGSGFEKGLQAAKQALYDSPAGFGNTENDGFLRWDADLAIVVVSDENDCSDEGNLPAGAEQEDCYTSADLLVPVVNYIDGFRNLKTEDRNVTFSAIVGPPVTDGCEDTKYGLRYVTVASNLGGLKGDICQTDWGDMMSDVGLIATGVNTWFALSHYPDPDTIEVTVDEVTVDHDPDGINGWTYVVEDNGVYFWGDSVPPRDSEVVIHYWTTSQ